ncbi:MAG: SDR family oxidoreductase [Myxococcales bacterium]|nr:SDR family oxidoreductase [Myxococcales bacterium]
MMITGCTGSIGAMVLGSVAQDPGVERIYVVGERPGTALPAHPDLRVVGGELGRPRFGLRAYELEQLGGSVDTIFHCAERTALDRDLEAARAANVQPVSTLVDLLGGNPGARLAHVSTTMVAGTKRGLFTEFDLACGQRFHNAYEQSKFEAETLLRESKVWDRVTVFRRSLTVEEAPGAGAPLSALLDDLRRRRPVLLAGDPRMRLDAVPLSYVVGSMVALARRPEALGQTLHLVAGLVHARPLGELVAALRGRLQRGRVGFVPPVLARIIGAVGLLTLGLVEVFPGRHRAFAPYFRHRQAFDDFRARALLDPLGLPLPSPEACLAEWVGASQRP